jgi:hypothetical protein
MLGRTVRLVGVHICCCYEGAINWCTSNCIYCCSDVDDCNPNPCLNHGKCVDGVDSYFCKCPRGFAGTNCEEGKELFV